MKILTSFCVITPLLFTATVSAAETSSTPQNIAIKSRLQIPGAVLPAGQYTFSLEDRLGDRAIVRIARTDSAEHFLLLAVPNRRIAATLEGGLILFDNAAGGKQVLRAWSCPGCDQALEMVYPKQEAAQITAASGQSVMATDPSYDRLPVHLSGDDMKVVTLWLLAPERVSNNRGYGLKAVKFAAETLPETASNRASFFAMGLLFLMVSLVLRVRDERRQRCPA